MISVVQLGALGYGEGLRLQRSLVELRKAGEIGDVLLLVEHSPVITLGRNGRAANVLASAEVLAARGVELFECDRGGDVTFHGPGQLVGYPILDLRSHELLSLDTASSSRTVGNRSRGATEPRKTVGAVDYVRRLEQVLIRTCADFGIAATRVAGLTGVWTEADPGPSDIVEKKIAAIGVHISRSVTSHGFALNVNTDLSYFDLIVPCGLRDKQVSSMQKELGRELDLDAVARSVSRNFGSVFSTPMLSVATVDALLPNRVGVPMKVPAQLRRVRGDDELFVG
jgi:lipoyl(octanoyl) transferase